MNIDFTALLGAGFVGGIASFLANLGKEYITRKKENERVYDNFKMNLFGELHALRYELADAIEKRDEANMIYTDIFYKTTDKKIDRSEGSEIDLAEKEYEKTKILVRELEIKFFKQLSLYLYKKKYNTKVADLERIFKTEGLKYESPIFNFYQSKPNEYLKFYANRAAEYKSFHTINVAIPLTEMIRCVMDDK